MDSSHDPASSAISQSQPTRRLTPQPVDEPAQPPAPGALQPVSGAAEAALVVNRGPRQGERFELTGETMSLGRHPECDIVLDDSTVSRRHAEVRREKDGYVIVDTGSLNGTYVNRQPVDRAALADGYVIWIGKFRLGFHLIPG